VSDLGIEDMRWEVLSEEVSTDTQYSGEEYRTCRLALHTLFVLVHVPMFRMGSFCFGVVTEFAWLPQRHAPFWHSIFDADAVVLLYEFVDLRSRCKSFTFTA
jgi:hypothetical protein